MRYTSRLSRNVLTLTIHKDLPGEELGLAFSKTNDNAELIIDDIFEDSLLSGSMLTPGMKLRSINKTMECDDLSIDDLIQLLKDIEGSFTMETTSPDGSPLHPWILQQKKTKTKTMEDRVEEIKEEPEAAVEMAPEATSRPPIKYATVMPQVLPDDIVIGVTRKRKHHDLGLRFTRIRATRVVASANTVPVASATILVVSQLLEGSPFLKTKLEQGMECIIINGIPGSAFPSSEDVYLMLQKSKGTITMVARKRDDLDLESLLPPATMPTSTSQTPMTITATTTTTNENEENLAPEEPEVILESQMKDIDKQTRQSIFSNDAINPAVVSDDEGRGARSGGGVLSMEQKLQEMMQSEHEKSWDRSNMRAGFEDAKQIEKQEQEAREAQDVGPFEVLVINKSKLAAKLHWDNGEDGVLVATLDAKVGEHRVTTYKGHSFFAIREEAKEDSSYRFTISHAEECFEIPEVEGVQFAVSFINKSVKSAKVYWDDGADGVLIATLTPNGGEHQVNTYKGHSFFARRDGEEREAQSIFGVSYEDEIFNIPEAKGVAFKVGFVNKSLYKVDLVWDDGGDGVVVATLDPNNGEHYATTYNGHCFFARKNGGSQCLASPKRNIQYRFKPSYVDEMFTLPEDAAFERKAVAAHRRVVVSEPTTDHFGLTEDPTETQLQEEKAQRDADDYIKQMENEVENLETETSTRIHRDMTSRRSLLAEVKGDMQSRRSLLSDSTETDKGMGSPLVSKRKIKSNRVKRDSKKRSDESLIGASSKPATIAVPRDIAMSAINEVPTTMEEATSEQKEVQEQVDNQAEPKKEVSENKIATSTEPDEPIIVAPGTKTNSEGGSVEGLQETEGVDDYSVMPVKDPLSQADGKGRRTGPAAFAAAFGALRKPKQKGEEVEVLESTSDSDVNVESSKGRGTRKKFLTLFRGNKAKTFDYLDDTIDLPPGAQETSSDDDSEPDLEQVYDRELTDALGFTGKYTGTVLIENGLPHGVGGIDYWMDDACIMATYDGDWEHGCWDGYGESALKCGDEYTGEFQLHERHGEGEYVWKTQNCEGGSRKERYYTGNFESNQRHGFGVFTWRTILDEKENLSVFKGMYHQGKRQGQGVYSTQKLKYSGEWFLDKYHGMGRLEVFDQFIHRGNFRHGNFVEKATVPPPFVLASQASQRHIKKRHNMIAELTQKADDRPKIEAMPNKYEIKEVADSTNTPARSPMITANMLAGAQLMKRAPVGDLEPVAVSLPPDSVRNPKKKTMLEELGAALKNRNETMSPDKRPIEIVSVPRKVKGPRSKSPIPPASTRSKSPTPLVSSRSKSPAPPIPLKGKNAIPPSKAFVSNPAANSSGAKKDVLSDVTKSRKANTSTFMKKKPPSSNPMNARNNMLAQLSKPPALKPSTLPKTQSPTPANPRMNLMAQLSQPLALKSTQRHTSPRPPASAPPKRKPTMMEELQAKLAAKS